ncbi:MAG: VOC family protein [Hyphomonadaceae bacterium]|nr:VOC family protein [Hyphomonadaceae bacterium]
MSATLHISLPVADLKEAEAFYVGALGAEIGRRRDDWMDVWLFGAQITLHEAPGSLLPVNGQGHRHFGATLSASDWEAFRARALGANVVFVRLIQTENAGAPDEQSKFMIADPSGNHIEFKTYPNEAVALERPGAL